MHNGGKYGESTVRESVFHWLGFDFVSLSSEAPTDGDATRQCEELFFRFRAALEPHGLDLLTTIRSRLFGRNGDARDAASAVRSHVLSGPARAATSSYIAPERFDSGALVAMDLIAVRPRPDCPKRIRENDPPRTPCRYLTCGPLVVLSGQTAVLPTLEIQVTTDILPRIGQYLAEAGSGWDRVAEVKCYLHKEESSDHMRTLFLEIAPALPPVFACYPVEGYSAPGKRVEVEVTALARP